MVDCVVVLKPKSGLQKYLLLSALLNKPVAGLDQALPLVFLTQQVAHRREHSVHNQSRV